MTNEPEAKPQSKRRWLPDLYRSDVPAPMTPMQLLQIAIENDADLDRLKQLMDLHERHEANQARKAYVVALSAFKTDPPTVIKNKSAGFDSKTGGARTEYEYATLAHVVAVVAPALSEHGLSHNWQVDQSGEGISVTCTLTHEMGHSETVTMRGPADTTGSKNPIQAIASSVNYLERYTLLAITGLAAESTDDDGAGVETFISSEQKEELIGLFKELNVDTAKFCRYWKIEFIDHLPEKKFGAALASLEMKRKQRGAQ